VAVATVESVVAAIAPDRIVVGVTTDDDIVTFGAAENHGRSVDVVTGIMQVVRIGSNGVGVVADHQGRNLYAVDDDAACRVSTTVISKSGKLLRLVNLERVAGSQERVAG